MLQFGFLRGDFSSCIFFLAVVEYALSLLLER